MSFSFVEFYAFLPAFLLVLFRVGGLILAAPMFNSSVLPARIKTMIAVAISLAVFPMMISYVPASITLGSAVAGLAGELAIGLFIGLGVTLLFVGIQIGAQLVGQQSGIRLGNVFNPLAEASGSILGQLYFLVALMVFLMVGGHRAVVRALLDSFAAIPPMSFELSANLLDILISICGLSFSIALRVAGPMILALMLALVTLGFISRTLPQLNILTVGFPIKLALALMIMALTIMSLEPLLLDGLTIGLDGIRAGLGLAPMS
ncbi:MAG: flagellar biosynthetic protein FliR [Planctomycetota bacterium]|nr:MAG: flagellar biosynthetic protein FliR [Planctomycetota bacterium]